jgi:cytochrome c oxidase subunit 1/cytochrome c oxidase subunit I+III
VERIPTVTSRDPLWDDHDEEADPHDDRILDRGEETLATTTLDAVDGFVAKMPEHSLYPLITSLLLMGIFLALVFGGLWVALVFTILTALSVGGWPNKAELIA